MYNPFVDPFALETQARQRHEEALRRAADRRLRRTIRRAGAVRPGLLERVRHMLGAWLVAGGYRLLALQGRARKAPTLPLALRLSAVANPTRHPRRDRAGNGGEASRARIRARPGRGRCRRPPTGLPWRYRAAPE